MKKKILSAVLTAIFASAILCSCSSGKNSFIESVDAEAPGNNGSDIYDVYVTGDYADAEDSGISYNYKVNTYSSATDNVIRTESEIVSAESGTAVEVSGEVFRRKIIYSSDYSIQTKTFDESLKNLDSLCAKYSAYYERSNTYAYDGSARRATFTVRVPVENYQDFVGQADSVGIVVSSSQNNKDVTESYFDTQARLDSAKIREERVLEILKNSSKLDDVLALERELADIRYEIESYTGTLRKYDSLISYATVEINISEVQEYVTPKVEPVSFGERIGSAFGRGIEEFRDGFEDFVVFLSYNFVPLIIWVVIIVVFVIVIKILIKKKKNTKVINSATAQANKGKEDKNQ